MSGANDRRKQNVRNKKNRKKQRIKLYIRRIIFMVLFIIILCLCMFFIMNGISAFFRGGDNSSNDNITASTQADDDTEKVISDDTGKENDSKKNGNNVNDNGNDNNGNDNNANDNNKKSDSENGDKGNDNTNTDKYSRSEIVRSGKVYDGIYLDELDISGMDYDTAIEKYNNYYNSSKKRKITFKDELGSFDTTFDALGISVDVEKAVVDALNFGRTGNILSRYKEIETLKKDNVTIIPEKTIDRDKLQEVLENGATDLVKDPVSSTMVRSEGQFIVYESQKGIAIDYEKTDDAVEKEIGNIWKNTPLTLSAATKETEPKYTEKDFYGVDSLLGRCVTEYNIKNSERIANLAVGAKKIADNVVLPGQQFSVYDTVAPFTEENGYKNAGQYINAELVDGMGGGICQVATTLYDAVLEAELQVDERYPHSMTVSYVDKGMDAAIAEGYQDFKFTNNTEYPIYIDAYAGGGTISVAIYGHETRSAGHRIQFESKVIETYKPGEDKTIYDDTLPSGTTNVTEAHTGYYVEVWKHIYQDGELTDSVKINGSEYQAIPKTTRIGTGTE